MKICSLAIALTLLAAFASDSWGQSQKKTQPNEQPQTTKQPTAADQRGTEQFPAFVKIIPSQKTDAETVQDAKDRQEKADSDTWVVRWTGAVAIFTLVLAGVGTWQGIQLKRSVDLARDEFDSSHRPRIIMRDVWCEPGGDILYMLFNTGDAPATIVESWILAEFIPAGRPLRPLRSVGHDDLGQLKFAAGEMNDLTYAVPGEIGAYMLIPDMMKIGTDEGPPMVGSFYFTGAILYADKAGNRRRSVFRRRWDRDRKCFVRLEDPDQEYAD